MGRLRCFFGGDKQSQRQVWDELISRFEPIELKVVSEERRVPDMSRLSAKALRIRDKNQKRVAFSDLYGTDLYKEMLRWMLGERVSPLVASMIVDVLEDFDEISLSSARGFEPTKEGKKTTLKQLTLALYPSIP
jgi:hypothetical protein